MWKGGDLVTDDAVNIWCLFAVGLAIAIVVFLVIHPLNCPSFEVMSLRSLLACFSSPWLRLFASLQLSPWTLQPRSGAFLWLS